MLHELAAYTISVLVIALHSDEATTSFSEGTSAYMPQPQHVRRKTTNAAISRCYVREQHGTTHAGSENTHFCQVMIQTGPNGEDPVIEDTGQSNTNGHATMKRSDTCVLSSAGCRKCNRDQADVIPAYLFVLVVDIIPIEQGCNARVGLELTTYW